MATLQRAFALAEFEHVAVRVRQHLHLEVAGGSDEAFDQQSVVAEGGGGLATRRLQRGLELLKRADEAHPFAAAAGRGLDQQRQAVLARELGDSRRRRSVEARNHRHPGAARRLPRSGLVAHQLDRLGRRPDPAQAGELAGARELGTLGEKSVAGMDRFGAAAARRVDDRLHIQVGVHLNRHVARADVQERRVPAGVHGRRRAAEASQRARDAHDDLATVGNQDALEHHAPRCQSIGPASSVCEPSGRPST